MAAGSSQQGREQSEQEAPEAVQESPLRYSYPCGREGGVGRGVWRGVCGEGCVKGVWIGGCGEGSLVPRPFMEGCGEGDVEEGVW